MDANLINEAILHGLEVEVWRIYKPLFGRDVRLYEEKMGTGRIVRQTEYDIILEDGLYYPKDESEIRIKQK